MKKTILIVLALVIYTMSMYANDPSDMVQGLTFEVLEGNLQNLRLVWDTPPSYNHVGPIIEGMDLYLYEIVIEFNGQIVNRAMTQDTRLTMMDVPFGEYVFSIITHIYELTEMVTTAGWTEEEYKNVYCDVYMTVYVKGYTGAAGFGSGVEAGVEAGVTQGVEFGRTSSTFTSVATNEYVYFVEHIRSSQPVTRTRSVREFAPPRNLSWEINPQDKVVLSWRSPELYPEEAFRIGYRVYEVGNPDEISSPTGHSFTDENTFPDNNYSYYVTALYQFGGFIFESAPSNIANAEVGPEDLLISLNPPRFFNATVIDENNISLNWVHPIPYDPRLDPNSTVGRYTVPLYATIVRCDGTNIPAGTNNFSMDNNLIASGTTYIYHVLQTYELFDDDTWSMGNRISSPSNSIKISVYPFEYDFGTTIGYAPIGWLRGTAILDSTGTFEPEVGGWSTSNHWSIVNYTNTTTDNGMGARVTFAGEAGRWLVAPEIAITDTTKSHYLSFDLALTAPNSTTQGIGALDDVFAVIVSTDDGETWSAINTVGLWTNWGSYRPTNQIPRQGYNVTLGLDGFRGPIRVAFYAQSANPATETSADLHIDNVAFRQYNAPLNLNPPQNLVARINWDVVNLSWEAPISLEGSIAGTFEGYNIYYGPFRVNPEPVLSTSLPPITLYNGSYVFRVNALYSYNGNTYETDFAVVHVNIPTIGSFPYVEDFNSTRSQHAVSRQSGELDIFSRVSQHDSANWSSTSHWRLGNFGNNATHANGQCAVLRIATDAGNRTEHWLVLPEADFVRDVVGDYYLTFDVALTTSGQGQGIAGPEDVFAVLYSTNNGRLWSEFFTIASWDNHSSAVPLNSFPNTGKNITVNMSHLKGQKIRLAFYGESNSATHISDIHIDNITIGLSTMPIIPPTVAVDISEGFMDLNWTLPTRTTGVLGYNIYRDNVLINSEIVVGTSFRDETAEYGENYIYNVTALYTNPNLESAFSNTINITFAEPMYSFALIGDGAGFAISKGTIVATDVVLPNTHQGLPVIMIADTGFLNYTRMQSVTIPRSITTFGNFAFSGCLGLTEIFIPIEVTTIGANAFLNCNNMTKIYAEAAEQPAGWASNWNPGNITVTWGHTVSDDDVIVPVYATVLVGNHPNPFNPTTTIKFEIGNGKLEKVVIDVYNIRGQHVRTLVNGEFGAGLHSVVWNGTDDIGRNVGSGIYFYRMTTDGYSAVRKMMLLK
jgi:hypothetical protein